ncbi:MAG: serine hydrolase domain-containing protein [Haloferacaceae archaeon]
MTRQALDAFERVLREGVADDVYTCAVAAVGSSAGEAHRCAVGEDDPERGRQATESTVFDLASVTKSVVTTTVVLGLVEEGRLSLSDTLGRHLPSVDGDRGEIAIRQLLTHTSGLQPYHFAPSWEHRAEAVEAILREDLLAAPPGERHEYSCLNFVHLVLVAEEVTGASLPELAEAYVFDPAGMEAAALGRPADATAPVAVTRDHEYGRGTLRGEIHDPIAHAMDGRSGNAGLFATVEDVSRFARTLLGDAAAGTNQLLAPTTVATLATDLTPEGVEPHGLGWRLGNATYPAPTWTGRAIGHTGYTGTSLWVDLERDRYCVLLTNEVYTGKEDGEMPRIRELAHAAAGAIPDAEL